MSYSGQSRPLIECSIERCPHCHQSVWFWLVELIDPFGEADGYSMACSSCEFEKLLSTADSDRIDLLRGEQFETMSEATIADLEVIQQIRAEGRVWECSACHEENPYNFGHCWNCGAESGLPVSEEEAAPPEMPGLASDKYPWE